MLTEPLPIALDVRKAAVRGTGLGGVIRPQDLKRFRPLLAGDEGHISIEMAFSRDDEDRYLVRVAIEAEVLVTCQRCLESMREHVSSDTTLAVVWTDAEAARLPQHLDPLVETEPTSNLWELVEDELILSIPPFSYHDTEECRRTMSGFSIPAPGADEGENKSNPFDVLGGMKPAKKHQE